MSKFEELCQSFTEARQAFKQYEAECKVFAVEIWEKMRDYYEIPLSQMSLHNIDAYGTPDRISGPDDLVLALRENGYFEFGLGITLYELPKKHPYPHYTTVLPIDISIDRDGVYKARYGEDGIDFIINRSKNEDFNIFFDEIFRSLKAEYDEGLANLRLQNTFRKIGFKED